MNINISLILIAVVIICCIFLNKLTSKTALPMLVVFIALGMLFGSEGVFKISFDNYHFAEDICSTALIFIIFYGGFGVKWREAKTVAAISVILSSVGVIITAFLTGMFCYFIMKMNFLESLLIGAVLSSTDATSVFSILRSKKLDLKYRTASVLELESGSNDPWAYMMTVIILSIMRGNVTTGGVFSIIFSQIIFGLGIGILISVLSVIVLKNIRFDTNGFNTLFVLATAILSYAVPTFIGGNGYISAYIVGIVLGNTSIKNKPELVNFFDGITGFSQILIFFLLGLLATPTLMVPTIIPALIILVFITLIARPVAVFLSMMPFKFPFHGQLLVAFSGLRGATSIVFAILAVVDEAYTNSNLFHIVFSIVLISIVVQGSLIPLVSRKLHMIDENENVLKTFNDYRDETEIQFIKLNIKRHSSWAGMKIQDITLPTGLLAVMIIRNDEKIIPKGSTVIMPNDVMILGAEGFYDNTNLDLTEYTIFRKHKWKNKKISEIKIPNNGLVILIKRQNNILIPNGKSTIKEDDVLVVMSDHKIKV